MYAAFLLAIFWSPSVVASMRAEVLQILQYMFLRTFFVEGARTEFLLLDSKFSIGNMVVVVI